MNRIEIGRERHDTPAYVTEALTLAGGRNLLGGPLYRVVWGWNRLGWIGGKWDNYDVHGNHLGEIFELREEPKYFATGEDGRATFDRWFVEKWQSADLYGPPWAWYQSTLEWENETEHKGRCLHALGPFPSRGEYEHVMTIATPSDGFLQLSLPVVETLARLVERSRLEPRSKKLAALRQREEKKQEADVERNLDILNDTSPYMKGSYESYAGLDARPTT